MPGVRPEQEGREYMEYAEQERLADYMKEINRLLLDPLEGFLIAELSYLLRKVAAQMVLCKGKAYLQNMYDSLESPAFMTDMLVCGPWNLQQKHSRPE